MSKAPLKQLSVNTFERNRIHSPKSEGKKKIPDHVEISSSKRKPPVCRQLNPIDELVVEPQTNNSVKHWQNMAEEYRQKLEGLMLENQQLHEIIDELNKDNEQLRSIVDNCQYVTNILEELAADD